MNKISSPSNEMLTRLAWEYYINDANQVELAARYGVSRPTISRLLKRARDTGVVQITIRADAGLCLELEKTFQTRYHLGYVRIVPSAEEPDVVLDGLGRSASLYLNRAIGQFSRLAVGWGRTISHIARFAQPEILLSNRRDCVIVEMVGNFASSSEPSLESLRLAVNLASAYGLEAHVLSAPAVANDAITSRALKEHPQIAEVLRLAEAGDFAIASLGTADQESTMGLLGLLSHAELGDLRKSGAVGEVLGRFFDREGRSVKTELDERLIGLTLDQLRLIPGRMIVAGGSHKAPAILGALRGALVTHLITDEKTARAVLDLETKETHLGAS